MKYNDKGVINYRNKKTFNTFKSKSYVNKYDIYNMSYSELCRYLSTKRIEYINIHINNKKVLNYLIDNRKESYPFLFENHFDKLDVNHLDTIFTNDINMFEYFIKKYDDLSKIENYQIILLIIKYGREEHINPFLDINDIYIIYKIIDRGFYYHLLYLIENSKSEMVRNNAKSKLDTIDIFDLLDV